MSDLEREGLFRFEVLHRSINCHPHFVTEEDPDDPVLQAAIVLDRMADDREKSAEEGRLINSPEAGFLLAQTNVPPTVCLRAEPLSLWKSTNFAISSSPS